MSPFTAFLRVRHPSIDPAAITSLLGLEPAHAWAAGSAREAAGGGQARAHPDTYWIAPLGDSGWERASLGEGGARGKYFWPPRQALPLSAFLLGQLRVLGRHKAFFHRIAGEGGSAEFAITLAGGHGEGIELDPGLLRSLAELGVGLSIEVGGAEGDA